MKAKIRVATDMYEFIELDLEGSIDYLWDSYKELKGMTKPKVGLAQKDWNASLDRYLNDGTGDTELYQQMNPDQQRVLQEIKKSFKRLQAKEARAQDNDEGINNNQ